MEELKNNKQFTILKWIFIIISIVHVIYAAITLRGLYLDGSGYMIQMLNDFANSKLKIVTDILGHPRFFVVLLQELPTMFSYFILGIKNKFALMMIFSFSLFFLPLLALYWNYKLSQRTNRIDIFFWGLFCYSCVFILFSIYGIVEILIGGILHFVLWNYLVSQIEYKKRDIIAIVFLITIMFATYEYVALLGIIFFISSIYYSSMETNEKSKYIKNLIGLGSLGASIFNILYMLNVPGNDNEIKRFLGEALSFYPSIWEMCSIFSIIAIVAIIIINFYKRKISYIFLLIIGSISTFFLYKFINNPQVHISPVFEGHFRCWPCIILPILFVILPICDFLKKKINKIKFQNFICIVLICGIFQTCWQIVNTYYWDKNIQFMKNELASVDELLYVPANHPQIADFLHPDARRYIWHNTYPIMSILFSSTYELKTLLLPYDVPLSFSNHSLREFLFVIPNDVNKIHVPLGSKIDFKNEFWNISKCAIAVDKYNKEHNIEMFIDEAYIKP